MEIEMLQGSSEWLDFRKNKIGASDAPVIMGVSPWKTPYQLWQEKVGFKTCDSNSWMKRGLESEEEARHIYGKIRGEMYIPKVYVSKDYPWMIASMDGVNFMGDKAVEIKCPGEKDHVIAKKGEVPKHYYPQLQHQICVLKLKEIDYFSFDGYENCIVKVPRDDKYIEELVCEEKKFHTCLLSITEPELSERDYIHRTDDEWEKTASQWLAVMKLSESIRQQEKDLRQELILLSGGHNTQGSGVKLKLCHRTGAIDYNRIPELQNVNLEIHRKKPTTYVLLKEEKEKI